MDSNGVNFWMLSQAQDWAPNPPILAAGVGSASQLITVAARLPWGMPAFLLIDAEVLSVGSMDATGTILEVSRGVQSTVPATHAVGTPVLIPVGILQGDVGGTDTQVTITAGPMGIPGFLQIDAEVLAVTQMDATGTLATVTRGALNTTPAAHTAGAPAFAPIGPQLAVLLHQDQSPAVAQHADRQFASGRLFYRRESGGNHPHDPRLVRQLCALGCAERPGDGRRKRT